MEAEPVTAAIRPLPTVYAGLEFRSRLEAKVAAGLDRVGAPWQYEPEGFRVGGVAYLPDFRLTAANVWLEVKPTWGHVIADHKAQALAGAGEAVFYAFDWNNELTRHHVGVVAATGTPGRLASAVWTRCPRCYVVVPWAIRSRKDGPYSYCTGCYSSYDCEEWWDMHYHDQRNPALHDRRWSDWPLGLMVPAQYRDGKMLWPR